MLFLLRDKKILNSRSLQASGEYFTPGVDSRILKEESLLGEGVTKEGFGDIYRIFVQSKGSGARHLAAGTCLVYEEKVWLHELAYFCDTVIIGYS